MLAVERGAAANTLAAYRRDLASADDLTGDLAKADDLLQGQVRSAQNAVIGKYAFNELVSTNKDELKLDEIEEEMKTRVAEASKVNGIEIIMVGIKRLGIPE